MMVFYVPFNIIKVISKQKKGAKERLCNEAPKIAWDPQSEIHCSIEIKIWDLMTWGQQPLGHPNASITLSKAMMKCVLFSLKSWVSKQSIYWKS